MNSKAPRLVPCPCCGRPLPEDDVRPVPPRWAELVELVDGARKRDFSEPQLDYFRACIGVIWTKAFRRGEGASGLEAIP
jgi:hypothetical protein